MRLEVIETLAALRSLEPEWRELAIPSPMQSPEWLLSWWEAYGEDDAACSLWTLAVRNSAGVLVGLAPCYVRLRTLAGPTLRLLGDGRASTDHHTILCRTAEDEPGVVSAVAKWVVDSAGDTWRRVRFEAIDADDRAMNHLERLLAEGGLDTQRIDDLGSFPAEMAAHGGEPTWENYLATLSKNRRKRLRKWRRELLDTGQATVLVAQTEADRQELWPLLVKLHRERREAMGHPGVFDEPRFDRFHRLASERLLAKGRLYLAVLELDGKPAAVDYALQDERAVYAYQGGIAPWALERDAGHLSQMVLAETALAAGRTRLDLLRGDEPYKLSWGAVHRPASTLHVRPRDAAGALERWAGAAYRSLRDRRLRASGLGLQGTAGELTPEA
ncbi:GNAT family N-acetyltransferase [Botrimarina sp.]|uniref:GNAT family N-acetyltransferase n=1 Tax=Botrimarina sp. TaxID=2795802 RepID=UPI0032EFA36B